MQEMPWLDTHLESIDEAIKLINQFAWFISVVESEQKWYVLMGEEEKTAIFIADSREAVDAFLYGMGLAYGCIPSPLFEKLAEDVNKWHKSL